MAHAPRPLPPPPAAARSSRALVVGLVLGLVLVVTGAAVAVVLAVTTSPAGSATPEAAVDAYLTATAEGDCEELVKHPITGFGDLAECEDDVAEQREQYEDDDIDPDSFTVGFDVMDVSEESGGTVTVSIDVTESYEKRGEEQYSGGYRSYEVVRDDDGSWGVTDLTYED